MSKIALIGEETFIMTSLKKSIEAAEHDVQHLEPTMKAVTKIDENVQMIIIYGDENIAEGTDVLVYLRDFAVEHEIRVGLIGYRDDVDKMQKVFSESLVWMEFIRPFNVKELVEQLEDELEKQENEEFKKHILVVDDSGMMLRTIESWLSVKYKVTIAGSAAMAISMLSNMRPDLILLDYEMPVCNGPQFLEMIRGEMSTQDIPVIFLTAKNDAESVKRVVALKPNGYLLKTMSQEEVLKNIDEFFEKQKILK